jgi:hypothetical protein
VTDRVCQQALLQRLEPIFEPLFDDSSFGFRPGRSTKDALRKIWGEIKAGAEWIVDADLKGYFGSVDHEKLMTLVAQRVADGRVLTLIEQMLAAGYQEQGRLFPTPQGTPQGGVVSPMLSNILLTTVRSGDAPARIPAHAVCGRLGSNLQKSPRSGGGTAVRREGPGNFGRPAQSAKDADRACASWPCVSGIHDQARQTSDVPASREDRLWGAERGSLCVSDAEGDQPVQGHDPPEDAPTHPAFHCGVGTGD